MLYLLYQSLGWLRKVMILTKTSKQVIHQPLLLSLSLLLCPLPVNALTFFLISFREALASPLEAYPTQIAWGSRTRKGFPYHTKLQLAETSQQNLLQSKESLWALFSLLFKKIFLLCMFAVHNDYISQWKWVHMYVHHVLTLFIPWLLSLPLLPSLGSLVLQNICLPLS